MNKSEISSTYFSWNALQTLKRHKMSWSSSAWVELILKVCAAVSILSILLIIIFIFSKGLPLFEKIGIGEFLFNLNWSPGRGSFGIGTMLVGSLAVTFTSMLWSVPMGLITASFYG